MAAKRKPPKGKPFKPGQSGNPAGRKPVPPDVKAIWEANTVPAAQKLVALMNCGEPELELKAAMALLDRALGKPAQAVTGLDGGPLEIVVRSYAEGA